MAYIDDLKAELRAVRAARRRVSEAGATTAQSGEASVTLLAPAQLDALEARLNFKIRQLQAAAAGSDLVWNRQVTERIGRSPAQAQAQVQPTPAGEAALTVRRIEPVSPGVYQLLPSDSVFIVEFTDRNGFFHDLWVTMDELTSTPQGFVTDGRNPTAAGGTKADYVGADITLNGNRRVTIDPSGYGQTTLVAVRAVSVPRV